MTLGQVGPAQSEYLYHFTGRNGDRPVWVPEDIRDASPQERLDVILREERFRAFAPFGAEAMRRRGQRRALPMLLRVPLRAPRSPDSDRTLRAVGRGHDTGEGA